MGLYLTNCIKLLTQAAWGHLGLHYAKKTSGKEPKLADPYGGPLYHTAPLNQTNKQKGTTADDTGFEEYSGLKLGPGFGSCYFVYRTIHTHDTKKVKC